MTKQNPDWGTQDAERVGNHVRYVDAVMQGWRDLQVDVVGLSVRGPEYEGGEYLVTVRGVDHEGARVVAFHSATSLMEILCGVSARLQNGSLAWKADQWAR
jgi:hypothetical protein